jgi:hypothetical protein
MVDKPSPPVAVPQPRPGQLITDEHLVLIHSSQRRPEYDEQHKAQMYLIYVIVYGHRDVLNCVEQVEYFLDPSYPTHYYCEKDRSKNFRLKELANGYSVIHAKVKIKGQEKKVELSRFINLTWHKTDLSKFFGGWHGNSIGGA